MFALREGMYVMSEEAHKHYAELCDKEAKYRWHDLRKNPKDLPDSTRKVEIVISVLGVSFEEHGYFLRNEGIFKLQSIWTGERNNWTYREYDLKEKMEVIAWRYIEPFDGGGWRNESTGSK